MKKYLKRLLFIGIGGLLLGGVGTLTYCTIKECKITELLVRSYEDCVAKGFPVENSTPPKCIVSKDKVFVKAPENIRLSEPKAKGLVVSPLTIKGEALAQNNTVYYRLIGEDKSVLAEGSTKTSSKDLGRFGEFTFTAAFAAKTLNSGTLEIFEKDPNGKEESMIKTPVIFRSEANRTQTSTFEPLESLAETPPTHASITVPFTPQAPFADWSDTYNEACEEASLIMIEYFYRGKALDANLANAEIIALIDWETNNNYAVDVKAEDLATIARAHFERLAKVYTGENVSVENIQKLIAAGYPVIIPAAGRMLGNPHYSGDGPPYHMLIISGYDDQGFITQDPGTKAGQNYRYTYDTLMNAIHDWTGNQNSIRSGQKAMLIIGK